MLKPIWLGCQQPCGKRLVAALPDWVPAYEQEYGALSRDVREPLLAASAATLDRPSSRSGPSALAPAVAPAPARSCANRFPLRPRLGTWIDRAISELDTVALCGGRLDGNFTWMLDGVDFCTQWVEARAVSNRGRFNTLEQLRDIEARLPFGLLGIDHDNGGELLNWHVLRYCQQRRQPVQMSRSRPYHQDDNAHVEQKNWTHIRQWFGYDRYDNPAVVPLLNGLTTGAWNHLLNYFCPVMKLARKERIGARLRRVYNQPATPYARVLASAHVSVKTKTALRLKRAALNPFALNRQIENELKAIYAAARPK